jgi:translation initiation factor IF-2
MIKFQKFFIFNSIFFNFQIEVLGCITSIENNHKTVPTARKGQEVCIKIEPFPGETPKMYGRHFDENDMLLSKVSYAIDRIFLNKNKKI